MCVLLKWNDINSGKNATKFYEISTECESIAIREFLWKFRNEKRQNTFQINTISNQKSNTRRWNQINYFFFFFFQKKVWHFKESVNVRVCRNFDCNNKKKKNLRILFYVKIKEMKNQGLKRDLRFFWFPINIIWDLSISRSNTRNNNNFF